MLNATFAVRTDDTALDHEVVAVTLSYVPDHGERFIEHMRSAIAEYYAMADVWVLDMDLGPNPLRV